MIYRLILPQWAKEEHPSLRRVREGRFSGNEILELNTLGYNIYFLPNYPSQYEEGTTVDGSMVDTFHFVFVDMDLKDGVYASKEDFIETVLGAGLEPTRIVDSGNGVHVYWAASDLDAITYLRLARRLMRKFKTDDAVQQVYQLMRVPGTVNTKHQDDLKLCEELLLTDKIYTSEDLDKFLPPILPEDDLYCQTHLDKTYNLDAKNKPVDDALPRKFGELLNANEEVRDIWAGKCEDRSASDYRLGHIMFATGFSKQEARSVLVNTAKAIARMPQHRLSYADNIIDKIWTYEMTPDKSTLTLSSSVADILSKNGDMLQGTRFPCHRYIDATAQGFRLGQVIGLIGGSGVGKTAMALNMFEGFVKFNPDYIHFFVPLEQPAREIAARWQKLCGDRVDLHEKVHVISNYDETGAFRHLSLTEIKDYLLKFQEDTGKKVGCVVIDHIGALKKNGPDGRQNIEDICHEMKGFAVQTNTVLVMQSQTNREKAGDGDLELNKDAAYGTMYFEAYCDFVVTIWQPLKKCHKDAACPRVTAFKFCKIRHKERNDSIQEDMRYRLVFDPDTGRMGEMLQAQERSFEFFNNQATNLRKKDRKTDVLSYESIQWTQREVEEDVRATDHDQDPRRTKSA